MAAKCEAHWAASLDPGFLKCGPGSLSSDQRGCFPSPTHSLVPRSRNTWPPWLPPYSWDLQQHTGLFWVSSSHCKNPKHSSHQQKPEASDGPGGLLGEASPVFHSSCQGQNRGHVGFAVQLMWNLTLTHHLGALRPRVVSLRLRAVRITVGDRAPCPGSANYCGLEHTH